MLSINACVAKVDVDLNNSNNKKKDRWFNAILEIILLKRRDGHSWNVFNHKST